MDKAFAAAFSDDTSKVQEISRAADEARAGALEEPGKVDTELETPTEPAKEEIKPEVTPEPEKAVEPEAPRTKTVPHEALHAERKAKEAERKRAEAAEARLAELEKKPKTSVLEDEDKAFTERLAEAVTPVKQQYFDLTVELAKEKPGREDYDEIYAFMTSECEAHPELVAQIVNAKRPGEEIYRLGKARKELAAVGGDITKLAEHAVSAERAKLTQANERIKALEAELAGRKASEQKRAAIPQSLNAESSAPAGEEVFKGPTPLKDILPKI